MIQDLAAPRALPTVEETRRVLADVLADPGLRKALQPRSDTFASFAELWHKIQTWFADLVDWLFDLREGSPGLFWLIFVALMLVACALLAHIGWTLMQAIKTPREGAPASPQADHARRVQSRALRAKAHALATGGDRRGGMRHLLLAMLALVEERRLLTVAQSWTVREILGRLAHRAPSLFAAGDAAERVPATALGAMSARIEHACYSDGAVPDADFAAVDRWLDDLLQVEPIAEGA